MTARRTFKTDTEQKVAAAKASTTRKAPPQKETKSSAAVGAAYFASGENKNLKFFSSGCILLDCALGGGYVLGRVVNLVGDKSSGKTLIAMEAAANFIATFGSVKDSWVRYGEAEAAFDKDYAAALGIPVDRIEFNVDSPYLKSSKEADDEPTMRTVEEVYFDLEWYLDNRKGPGLYIIDSLDALSDEAEQERKFTDGTYGGTKPKKIGEMFRRLVGRCEDQGVTLLVISQIRDKLNVTFGETKTRSGGHALDFYASHIVWLAELGKLKKTMSGVERVTGIEIEAYVKKNKVGPAFRKARYPIIFGYGIDDMTSAVEWLIEIGRERLVNELGMKKGSGRAKTRADAAEKEKTGADGLVDYKKHLEAIREEGGEAARALRARLAERVVAEWARIEMGFLPKGRKY